jgi:hypothetical protein
LSPRNATSSPSLFRSYQEIFGSCFYFYIVYFTQM